MATTTQRLENFAAAEPASLEEVLAFFDELPPVSVEDDARRLGRRRRRRPATRARGSSTRCAGSASAFSGADDVDPIDRASTSDGERAAVSDVMGSATLRMVEYRGVVTATMVYDRHPVFDHFRRVDDDTVLGVMDRKGEDRADGLLPHPKVSTGLIASPLRAAASASPMSSNGVAS